MKGGRALALVLSVAVGVLLTAGGGGALGVFDRGPTEADVQAARAQGRAEGAAEVDARSEARAEEAAGVGYRRGREAAEWLSLDRLPNAERWFAGVVDGVAVLEEVAAEAYEAGAADGERQGRADALQQREAAD